MHHARAAFRTAYSWRGTRLALATAAVGSTATAASLERANNGASQSPSPPPPAATATAVSGSAPAVTSSGAPPTVSVGVAGPRDAWSVVSRAAAIAHAHPDAASVAAVCGADLDAVCARATLPATPVEDRRLIAESLYFLSGVPKWTGLHRRTVFAALEAGVDSPDTDTVLYSLRALSNLIGDENCGMSACGPGLLLSVIALRRSLPARIFPNSMGSTAADAAQWCSVVLCGACVKQDFSEAAYVDAGVVPHLVYTLCAGVGLPVSPPPSQRQQQRTSSLFGAQSAKADQYNPPPSTREAQFAATALRELVAQRCLPAVSGPVLFMYIRVLL